MTPIATKQHILDAAGYIYNFDRQVYFNRAAKKVFSVEFIADHNGRHLERSIREHTAGREWKFYFNEEPPESVKRHIAGVLG